MKDSPLSEVVRDRRINRILEAIRMAIRFHQPITIEPKDVDYIRRNFHHGIVMGEQRLHKLAQALLCAVAKSSKAKCSLIVLGRCPNESQSDVLMEAFDLGFKTDELYSSSDSYLAKAHAPTCPRCRIKANTIASYVQYVPDPFPEFGLLELRARIKTTSNTAYKIADMVFDIDGMFQRDKIYNEFSQIVTDIYGVKVLVKEDYQIQYVLKMLKKIPEVVFVEEKDYTGIKKKKSGYEAYKVVIKKDQQLFEVQIQSKAMADFEKISWTANHQTYKERQMAERKKLGKEYLDVYDALARLLSAPDENYCELAYVELGYNRKGLDDEF